MLRRYLLCAIGCAVLGILACSQAPDADVTDSALVTPLPIPTAPALSSVQLTETLPLFVAGQDVGAESDETPIASASGPEQQEPETPDPPDSPAETGDPPLAPPRIPPLLALEEPPSPAGAPGRGCKGCVESLLLHAQEKRNRELPAPLAPCASPVTRES